MSDTEQANKKRRISSPTTQAALPSNSQTAVASQPAQVPDEDTAAPPSTAAGAHAKPLSALFAGPVPASQSAKAAAKGKGKAKEGDDESDGDEGFESTLRRLQGGGE